MMTGGGNDDYEDDGKIEIVDNNSQVYVFV